MRLIFEVERIYTVYLKKWCYINLSISISRKGTNFTCLINVAHEIKDLKIECNDKMKDF